MVTMVFAELVTLAY